MRDVALLAGVSAMTVSRVLNESTAVSPETRRRVLDAVRELAYVPNAVARNLARGAVQYYHKGEWVNIIRST